MGNTFDTGRLRDYIFYDASGNIGIAAAPSGSYKFEVTGTGRFSSVLTLSAGATILSGSEFKFYRTDNGIYTTLYDAGAGAANGFILNNTNGEGFHFKNASSTIMRMTSAGNIGFNTTTPTDYIDGESGIAYVQSSNGRAVLSLVGTRTTADEALGRISFTNTNATTAGSKRLAYISGVRGTTNNSAYLEFAVANDALGAPKMWLTQTGYLGIGTQSPLHPLTVATPSSAVDARSGAYIYSTNSMGANLGGQLFFGGSYTGTSETFWASIAGRKENATDADVAGYLAFATRPSGGSNTERMRITSTGNVGIGTSSPTAKLEIQNSPANDWGLSVWGNTTTSQSYGGIIRGGTNANDVSFRVNNAANTSTYFTVNGDGKLGIGLTTGTGKVFIKQVSAFFYEGLNVYSSSNDAFVGIGHTGSLAVINSSYNSTAAYYPLAFYTSDTERMRITSGGNVLIGTTSSPSAYGLVAIRGTNQGLTIQDAVSNGYRSLYYQSGNLYFYNGTNEGYLSSGGTWVNASDVTLKKDVKEIEYGLKEVMELKPKWYRMIEDDLEQIGFIAQDVEEVLPELVSTSEKGMKGLSYGQLTAVLVKAIQELNAKVSALENKS